MNDNRTFRPSIQEDRTIRAGGLTLAEIDAKQGELVFQDRYQRRCQARGTPTVRVSIQELIDEIMLYYLVMENRRVDY